MDRPNRISQGSDQRRVLLTGGSSHPAKPTNVTVVRLYRIRKV